MTTLTKQKKDIKKGKISLNNLSQEEVDILRQDLIQAWDIQEAAKNFSMMFELMDLDTLAPYDKSMDRNEFIDDCLEKHEILEFLLYPEKERVFAHDN
jgi:hypothetical protein